MSTSKFNTFKSQFQTDTKGEAETSVGLPWDENISMYILYYKARIIDDFLGNPDGRFTDTDFRNEFKDKTTLVWDESIANFILYYRDCVMDEFLSTLEDRLASIETRLTTLETSFSTFRTATNERLDDIEGRLSGHGV